jgi:zinc/manganese transport system substrate-binding protein
MTGRRLHTRGRPPPAYRPGPGVGLLASTLLVGLALVGAGCANRADAGGNRPGVIDAVGAENQYADVLSQIGGRYVDVSSILDNPNTDPHAFEASTSVAEEVSRADLIVQNGVGYDDFMDNIEAATPNPDRRVVIAQHVLGLPDSTPNPHLWYDPSTMPAVAKVMARDLSALDPSHPPSGMRTPEHRSPSPSRWPTTSSERWEPRSSRPTSFRPTS